MQVYARAQLSKSLGGEMKAFYYTLGQYDFVAINEAPSIEAALKARAMHRLTVNETLPIFFLNPRARAVAAFLDLSERFSPEHGLSSPSPHPHRRQVSPPIYLLDVVF